jgi:hypothetical protein
MNPDAIKRFRFAAADHANELKPLGIMKWNEVRDEKFAELIIEENSSKMVAALMSDPNFAKAMDAYYEIKWAHRFD